MHKNRNIKEMDVDKETFLCVLPFHNGSCTTSGSVHPILEPNMPQMRDAVNEGMSECP